MAQPSLRPLRPIEHRTLEVLDRFHRTKGYAPTVREMAGLLGISSSSTIHHRLESMKVDGLVDWVPDSPRTIHLTVHGLNALANAL